MSRAWRLLILIPLVFGCQAQSGPGCYPGVGLGAKRGIAPDFTLPLLREPARTVTLSEAYRQGPVLLAFWATWCPPCVEEIPILNDWVERYGRGGLQIIAVNVEESFERLVDFAKENHIAYPVLMDTEGQLAHEYGLVGLPVSVFIAKGGEILYYGFGLPSHIEALMSKGSVAQ